MEEAEQFDDNNGKDTLVETGHLDDYKGEANPIQDSLTVVSSSSSSVDIESTLQASIETYRRRIMNEAQDYIRRRILDHQTTSKQKINELLDEKEVLMSSLKEKDEKINQLKNEIVKQREEIESGKSIIQQFFELVNDKTSLVCRYCRRSGTLPPIPLR